MQQIIITTDDDGWSRLEVDGKLFVSTDDSKTIADIVLGLVFNAQRDSK